MRCLFRLYFIILLSMHVICLKQKDGVKVSDLITNGDILLDMRTPGEYQTNSVKGAINLPITSVYKGLNSLDK